MKRRIISTLLTLSLVVGLLPINAMAEETVPVASAEPVVTEEQAAQEVASTATEVVSPEKTDSATEPESDEMSGMDQAQLTAGPEKGKLTPIKAEGASFETIADAVKGKTDVVIVVDGNYSLKKDDLAVLSKLASIELRSGRFNLMAGRAMQSANFGENFTITVGKDATLALADNFYGADSRMTIDSGYIILRDLNKFKEGKTVIEINGSVRVPSGKVARTMVFQDLFGKGYGAILRVNGSLTVENGGILKIVSGGLNGENAVPSSVDGNGSFVVKEGGVLSLALNAKVNRENIVIEKSGFLNIRNEVNSKGKDETPFDKKDFDLRAGAILRFMNQPTAAYRKAISGLEEEFKSSLKDGVWATETTLADAKYEYVLPVPPTPQPPQPPITSGGSGGGSGAQSSVRPDRDQVVTIQDEKTPQAEAAKDPADKIIYRFTIGKVEYTKEEKTVVTDHVANIAPRLSQDRVMMPARMVSEVLGVEVKYDSPSKTATFTYGENKAELTLGKKVMMVNGEPVELTAQVIVAEGRILLPLTDIQKAFAGLGLNVTVTWDAATKVVTIVK